jgi:hypothetical protein
MESVSCSASAAQRRVVGDLWRSGGLGPARYKVWCLLEATTAKRARELADAFGRKCRVVQCHLADLERHGLAVRDGAAWRRGEADPDAVAASLGVVGHRERQQERHQRDRQQYRDALALGEIKVKR